MCRSSEGQHRLKPRWSVVMNAWDVWHPAEFDEDHIRRELARIRQKQ